MGFLLDGNLVGATRFLPDHVFGGLDPMLSDTHSGLEGSPLQNAVFRAGPRPIQVLAEPYTVFYV